MYQKGKPRGRVNFRPGSNPNHEEWRNPMTQADRVHSTPPTNTPVDTTRRRLLTAVAGGAVAAMAISTTAQAAGSPADPIFAAIEAFRRADASCVAVHGDIPDELGDQLFDAYSVVLLTRPTTPAGLAALTTWARERADWLCANASGLDGEDLCALTASIDDATRGMSGLKPWSPPLPAAMAVSADPTFAVIAEKLAADVAHEKAIDAQGEFDGRRDYSSDAAIEARDNSAAACHFANEVDWKLATTPPTTIAGVAALLRFANEIEDAGGEWPHTDTIGREGWHYQLRATMAAAIEELMKGGKANA
jgi:hypothetical protein